jgi:hypothetical protein
MDKKNEMKKKVGVDTSPRFLAPIGTTLALLAPARRTGTMSRGTRTIIFRPVASVTNLNRADITTVYQATTIKSGQPRQPASANTLRGLF